MIVETSGWRHLKEKNKLFLSCEYQKMYHPSQEMAQLSNVPQIKNGKPDFSPTFQKVELRNSTFFQLKISSVNIIFGKLLFFGSYFVCTELYHYFNWTRMIWIMFYLQFILLEIWVAHKSQVFYMLNSKQRVWRAF